MTEDDTQVLKLDRYKPDPGQIGGHVADAVVFPDGTSILKWRTDPCGIEIYPTEAAMRTVRERSGRSQFIRTDSEKD